VLVVVLVLVLVVEVGPMVECIYLWEGWEAGCFRPMHSTTIPTSK
jgi:hypothetical protein